MAVLLAYAKAPKDEEATIFHRCMTQHFGFSEHDAKLLREMALLSETAVLHGKCCAPWDAHKPATDNPCNSWFRDDRLGGFEKLDPVFLWLAERNELDAALDEKAEAVRQWRRIRDIAERLDPHGPQEWRGGIIASAEYGLRLFAWIEAAWRVLALPWQTDTDQSASSAFTKYDTALAHYRQLPEEYPQAASLFEGGYWNWPGTDPEPGLIGAVEVIRCALSMKDGEMAVAKFTDLVAL